MSECEYCNRGDVVLYGWHADVWCRSCIEIYAGVLDLTGSLDDAPVGRPENATYAQPFILQLASGELTQPARPRR